MINVLLVENTESVVKYVTSILKEKANVTNVITLTEGLSSLKEIDIVLLDLDLPDSKGLNSLEKMLPYDIPIIILTDNSDEKIATQSIKMGAQDYLMKGDFNGIKLWHTILYAIERYNRDIINIRINTIILQHKAILDKLDVIINMLK